MPSGYERPVSAAAKHAPAGRVHYLNIGSRCDDGISHRPPPPSTQSSPAAEKFFRKYHTFFRSRGHRQTGGQRRFTLSTPLVRLEHLIRAAALLRCSAPEQSGLPACGAATRPGSGCGAALRQTDIVLSEPHQRTSADRRRPPSRRCMPIRCAALS